MANWTIKKLLAWTDTYFGDHGIDSPRLTAEILLSSVLQMRRLDLYLQHDRPLEKQELAEFKALIRRRIAREPVAYITGTKGFFEDTFQVAQGVLIPRPDTEVLVEHAIELARSTVAKRAESQGPVRVMELGVGSGAIIVSLAKACPEVLCFACDISPAALGVAAANAGQIAQGRVQFFQGSWLDAVSEQAQFDLILSNPPYIPARDIEELEPEVRDHEPRLALDGGTDGFDAYRIILEQAGPRLWPGGRLMLEMGYDQKEGMTRLADQQDWVQEIDFIRDLAGHHRLAILKK